MKDNDLNGALFVGIVVISITALILWGANIANSSCLIRSEGPASGAISGRLLYQNLSVLSNDKHNLARTNTRI